MSKSGIRVIVFKEEDWWVAQCLEYDLATQTQRLEEMPSEFQRLLAVQVAASRESGIEPFQGFTQAPRRYWEMYERARIRIESVQPITSPVEGFEILDIRVLA